MVGVVCSDEKFQSCAGAVGLIPLNINIDGNTHAALFYAYNLHAQIELIWGMLLQLTRCSMQRWLVLYRGAKI